MPKKLFLRLLLSMAITTSLWWVDNDPPNPHFTDTLKEMVIIGPIYVGAIFFLLTGVVFSAEWFGKVVRG